MYIENSTLDNLSKQVEEKLQLVKAYDPKSEEGKEAGMTTNKLLRHTEPC